MSHRLIISTLLALGVHLAFFRWYIPDHTNIVRPEPLAVQRIIVSLGGRPAIQTQPEQIRETEPVAVPEPEPEPATKPESIVASPGYSSTPVPVPESVLKPVLKNKPVPHIPQPPVRKIRITERVKKQQVAMKAENREVQQDLPSMSGLETEEDQDQDQKETAAQVIQKASPLYQLNPPPKYPRLARRRGYEGLVVLKVDVDEYGRPTTVTMFAGSGHSLLDKAALRAVRKWRFQPGSIDGIPQKMTIKVPVRFRLDDE